MLDDKIERVPPDALKPYANNARTHSKRQIDQIAKSIERFGFTNPILTDDALNIVAGHGRVAAARQLGLSTVPVLRLSHLSPDDRRAYVLADNRLAEKAGWDRDLLAVELQGLIDLDFDMAAIGFETAEIDAVLSSANESEPNPRLGAEDAAPEPREAVVTRAGDIWVLGRHRLLCGDAREQDAYARLMGDQSAQIMFTDPPYNVPIEGFVGGLGKTRHGAFAMGCGEMSSEDFTSFLKVTLGAGAAYCCDGAIAFVCMDWRHLGELLAAGNSVFDELKNVCVWAKTNGGMGSLYRSQHELVFVFKKGASSHCNNVELGRNGRYRTNLWSYAGVNTFKTGREDELAMHPTVKPVALIEDALKDVSRRGDLVLDPFGGSGSTLIAAEKCGRTARLIEISPSYCDVIVRRFEAYTGKNGQLTSGENLNELAQRRLVVD